MWIEDGWSKATSGQLFGGLVASFGIRYFGRLLWVFITEDLKVFVSFDVASSRQMSRRRKSPVCFR